MTRRLVLFLDPPELTPRQLAQKKYRESEKGRAARARTLAKQRAQADYRDKKAVRRKAWRARNAVLVRVYMRTYMRRWRRERQQASA